MQVFCNFIIFGREFINEGIKFGQKAFFKIRHDKSIFINAMEGLQVSKLVGDVLKGDSAINDFYNKTIGGNQLLSLESSDQQIKQEKIFRYFQYFFA